VLLVLTLELAIFGAFPFWEPLDDDPELAEAIGMLESLRAGKNTDFDRVESRAAELLERFPEPERRGILLFHVVNVYAQSGMQRRDVLYNHAERAVALLKEPSRRAALHTFAGDASRLGIAGPPDHDGRRQAATWYLRGLEEVISLGLPAEVPPDELTVFFRTGDRDEDKRLADEQRKRLRQRNFQLMMQLHEKVLTDQITSLYTPYPSERADFEVLCANLLRDHQKCKEILERMAMATREAPVVPIAQGPPKPIPAGRLWFVYLNVGFLAVLAIAFVIRRRLSRTRRKRHDA
jgi:hypothetical protein